MLAELAVLEERMSYAEMVHVRMESRRYVLPPPTPPDLAAGKGEAGQACGGAGPCGREGWVEELMKEQGHPRFEEYAALAALVAAERARRWHDDASLREVLLDKIRFENVEVDLYGEPPPGTAPTHFHAGQHEVGRQTGQGASSVDVILIASPAYAARCMGGW